MDDAMFLSRIDGILLTLEMVDCINMVLKKDVMIWTCIDRKACTKSTSLPGPGSSCGYLRYPIVQCFTKSE